MKEVTTQYEGLPFFIHTGKSVSKKELGAVESSIYARLRNTDIWRERYYKGCEVLKAIKDRGNGAVQNINMLYAYNAYQKFLTQSLLSLKDTFRLTTNNYQVGLERPTEVLKSYLTVLSSENSLIATDAILYGCAALVLDFDITDTEPRILFNRVQSAKLFYDFEQPGASAFTIRLTPELIYTYDFLSEDDKMELYNKAIASATNVAELRVFIGSLVVNSKMDYYVALIHDRKVIYAEKERELTQLKAVSIYDQNSDFSPIYTVLKASELTQDSYKIIMDYNDKLVNPIRCGSFNIDANAWNEAYRTRYLKLSNQQVNQLTTLLPGQMDVNGLVALQTNLQTLSQQAAGLNDYTLGESAGSVRTYGEAMMLADSASGIMNILAMKLKQKLILPMLSDILEFLKITTQGYSDIFDSSLSVDMDVAKDQQEANILLSLVNMPMFAAVVQSLDSVQALDLFRSILDKLHISGMSSVVENLKSKAAETEVNKIQQNQNTNTNQRGVN